MEITIQKKQKINELREEKSMKEKGDWHALRDNIDENTILICDAYFDKER